MNNEEIAIKISERMNRIIGLPGLLARVERLRQICGDVECEILDIDQRRAQLKADLLEHKGELVAATQDVDDALTALYRPVDAPIEIVEAVAERVRRGKKKKEGPVPAEDAVKAVFECLCGDVYYDKEAFTNHVATCKQGGQKPADVVEDHGHNQASRVPQLREEEARVASLDQLQTDNEEAVNAAPAEKTETENPETPAVDAGDPPGGGAAAPIAGTYTPLDEPLGDCEHCMGYGLAESEGGELEPCTCEAGVKVKGGVVSSACDNCNIEDPNCAECHMPDMDTTETVADLPRCHNGSCTANEPGSKNVCLRIDIEGRPGRLCSSFVEAAACKHPTPSRAYLPNGAMVCDLCNAVLKPAPPKQGLTPLQQKCTHPKGFRVQIEGGFHCKCCNLDVLYGGGQQGLFTV